MANGCKMDSDLGKSKIPGGGHIGTYSTPMRQIAERLAGRSNRGHRCGVGKGDDTPERSATAREWVS